MHASTQKMSEHPMYNMIQDSGSVGTCKDRKRPHGSSTLPRDQPWAAAGKAHGQ